MDTVEQAARILGRGGLVAFPTETVYGLGADAANPSALARLFAVKRRPHHHPLIVHLPAAHHLSSWASTVPDNAAYLAEAFWPGPLTLVLKRAAGVLDLVTGGQETVAVRIPGHPLALELLAKCGKAIAAPSANRFGRLSPTTAEHVRRELGEEIDLIVDGGPCTVGLESTIVDLSGHVPRLLRPGGVSVGELERVIGPVAQAKDEQATRAPGGLPSHYAPMAETVLVLDGADYASSRPGKRVGILSTRERPAGAASIWVTLPANPELYARGLYAALRDLDDTGVDVIAVEEVPDDPAWLAIRDRLTRAAASTAGEA